LLQQRHRTHSESPQFANAAFRCNSSIEKVAIYRKTAKVGSVPQSRPFMQSAAKVRFPPILLKNTVFLAQKVGP
jgi:hypothetical protein